MDEEKMGVTCGRHMCVCVCERRERYRARAEAEQNFTHIPSPEQVEWKKKWKEQLTEQFCSCIDAPEDFQRQQRL